MGYGPKKRIKKSNPKKKDNFKSVSLRKEEGKKIAESDRLGRREELEAKNPGQYDGFRHWLSYIICCW